MRCSQFSALYRLSVPLSLALTLVLAASAQAATHEKVLYRFTGGADGAWPSSNLIMDAAGNLYGTAGAGGNLNCTGAPPGWGCGVVFELTPSANGKWQ